MSMGISWSVPAASSGQEGTFVHGRGRNVVGTSTGSVSVPLLRVRVRGRVLGGVSSCSGLLQDSPGAGQEGSQAQAALLKPHHLRCFPCFLGATGCWARVG